MIPCLVTQSFPCEWNSRNRKYHYNQKEWPKRESLIPGQKNVVNTEWTLRKFINSAALQTWTHKIFCRGNGSKQCCIYVLKNKFPRISNPKIKEGVFVGPQITELIQDVKFEDQLSEVEKAAWKSFKNAATSLFGSYEADSCRDCDAWCCTIVQSNGV